ncbi:MAG: hypothetical protein M1812_002984 [Candelaria pacifica]|nr:MAG: hypothetical protein M1812_002984 [Candelaria pacifica]
MVIHPKPIQLTIPPSLLKYNVTPAAYLAQNPDIHQLVVGALIFATPVSTYEDTSDELTTASSSKTDPPDGNLGHSTALRATETLHLIRSPLDPCLLLVQRSLDDTLPDRWEIPGGSCDTTDPTLFHSLAREVFEETGLHVTRIVREVGPGERFQTGNPHSKQPPKTWLKLSFEVEVEEVTRAIQEELTDCIPANKRHLSAPMPIPEQGPAYGKPYQKTIKGVKRTVQKRLPQRDNKEYPRDRPRCHGSYVLDSIPIVLDPKEHRDYIWESRDQILLASREANDLLFTGLGVTNVIFEGFRLRNDG